jgi:hypothetical protein
VKLLRMIFRRDDREEQEVTDTTKVEELAAAKSASDATLLRVDRVLSARDDRLRKAVSASGRAVARERYFRRMGG